MEKVTYGGCGPIHKVSYLRDRYPSQGPMAPSSHQVSIKTSMLK